MRYLCLVYGEERKLQSLSEAEKDQLDDVVDVIDGPFAETKEQLLGFILIEAKDKDDAVGVASKIPLARLGTIEVRPIMTIGEK